MTDTKYDAPADQFPEKGSSGSGTDTLYSVQARYAYGSPVEIVGHLLDTRWSTLHFAKAPIGVPQNRLYQPAANLTGLMSYEAAQALRWWFVAEARCAKGVFCLHTRLVAHRVQFSWSEESIAEIDEHGSSEPRVEYPKVVAAARPQR